MENTVQIHTAHYEIDTERVCRAWKNTYSRDRMAENLKSLMDESRSYLDAEAVLHWVSNDAVVPDWVFEEAGLICPEFHKAARRSYEDAVIAQYSLRQPAEPSDEERFEALAAFGPGEEVVDVFTGRRYTT